MPEGTRVFRIVRPAIERDVRRLVLDIVADLVVKTPVDTGWARANWLPSIGSPITSPAGSRTGIDSGAQARGVALIATSFKTGQTAFITNNVPYIEQLADGHSPQAEAGWVESTIGARVDAFNRGSV